MKWFVFSSRQIKTGRLRVFFTGNFTNNFVPANITLQEVTGAPEEYKEKREKIKEFCKKSNRTLSVNLVGIFRCGKKLSC